MEQYESSQKIAARLTHLHIIRKIIFEKSKAKLHVKSSERLMKKIYLTHSLQFI